MRAALVAFVAALAAAAALAPVGGATNECKGIQACIRVPGPWVLVPAGGSAQYLLSCPGGKSVVAGLDAQATSRDVRVGFVGRLGAPVQPGVTTTTNALFQATSSSKRSQTFQPLLGCVPAQGGGGRSTVSARTVTPAGPAIVYRAAVVVIGPGQVRTARVSCQPTEKLVGSWQSLAFRIKKPPAIDAATAVHVTHVVAGKRVVATAIATDGLTIDVHAIVQVGAECAP